MYLVDYHVHPNYSADAEDFSIDQYCQRALEIGLQEICFTTHFECDPKRKHIDWVVRFNNYLTPMEQWSWIDGYFREIEVAREKYGTSGLSLKTGVEVGYDLGLDRTIEKLLHAYPWDFVLGSVHCLNHIAISSSKESPTYFSGCCAQTVCDDYFAILREAIQTGLFHCIGHLDIYKRYGLKYFQQELYLAEQVHIKDALQAIAKQGMGIEINTSGIRKGSDFLPSQDLVGLAKECGVQIFTVGSDAHRLGELGMGVDLATEILWEQGLALATFRRGEAQLHQNL